MRLSEFNQKLQENKWLIAAILFFIIWKFFLIHILWQDRSLAPEPDDSYNYISQIATVVNCPNFQLCTFPEISMHNSSGYVYLSYRLFFGYLAKVFNTSPQDIYHLSFYVGTLFLAFSLVPFLKIFTHNTTLIAWSIFFLSFYHGLGETHGFFWVVPSFFSLLLFFLLASYCLRQAARLKTGVALLVTIAFTFSHPMSVFLILVLPLYLVILTLVGHKPEPFSWKKTALVVSLVLSFSLLSNYATRESESQKNAYSVKETILQVHSLTKSVVGISAVKNDSDHTTINLMSFNLPNTSIEKLQYFDQNIRAIQKIYLSWIFPHWIFVPLFFLCLFILTYSRDTKLIVFYTTCFLFFVISTLFHPYGFRSGVIIWPITFLLFAFSSWYSLEIIRTKLVGMVKYLTLTAASFFIFSFFIINATLAIAFNEKINHAKNYTLDPALLEYLIQDIPDDQTLSFSSELVIARITDIPTIKTRTVPFSAKPDYSVMTDITKLPSSKPPFIYTWVKDLARRAGLTVRGDAPTLPHPKPTGYTLIKEFGIFHVYQKDQ